VDGAAIKDIIKVIRKRFPVHIVLYPVRVQGDGAAAEIANAIEKMNARKDIDVIIVGRGGGSWEDLWAFNEEIVARAIYNSKIPIISAVGHERDYTIADFVADMRAPAPSAAAEMVVPDMRDVEARLFSMVARMEGAVRNRVEMMRGRLDMFNEERFLREMRRVVDRNEENLNKLKEMLIFLVKRKVEVLKENIEMLTRVLDSSSPYKALERGYAIVMLSNNEIFKSVDDVDVGDVVRVRVKDGETKCQVKEKKKI
jgi:exodeoxyribonuclease VII large subunit